MELKRATGENFIEKSVTDVIKGAALICMFIHHFFTFPEWYIDGIAYPSLVGFARHFRAPTQICVSVFAFLTGYVYYYSKNKTYKYSLKKITDVLLTYLISFLALLLIAVSLGVYEFSPANLLLEAIAIRRPTMCFCWYVVFYAAAMLLLPIYARLSGKSSALAFLLSLLTPFFISFAADRLMPGPLREFNQVAEYLQWFPCAACGFLFAKHGLFFTFSGVLKTKSGLLHAVILLALIAFAAMAKNFTSSYDFACAPLFVYGITGLHRGISAKGVFRPLAIIGRYSLIMWFLHCVFFNTCRSFTQPILFFPRNPIAVLAWGLALCLAAAALLRFPTDAAVKLKNRLLKL